MPAKESEKGRLFWLRCVDAARRLFVPQPDDRALDQFLPVREKTLALVQSERFLNDWDLAWNRCDEDLREILDVEMTAFALSIEVAQVDPMRAPDAKSPPAALDWLSTVVGSAQDLLNLSPWGKGALTAFKELVDIWKGKG